MSVEQFDEALGDIRRASYRTGHHCHPGIAFNSAFIKFGLGVLEHQMVSKCSTAANLLTIVDGANNDLARVCKQRDALQFDLDAHKGGLRDMFGIDEIVEAAVRDAAEGVIEDYELVSSSDVSDIAYDVVSDYDFSSIVEDMTSGQPCAEGLRGARNDIVSAFEKLGAALSEIGSEMESVSLDDF
jgi:hypothetical protein